MAVSCASTGSGSTEFGDSPVENVIIMEAFITRKVSGPIVPKNSFNKKAASIQDSIDKNEAEFAFRIAQLYGFYLSKIQRSNIIILPAEELLCSRNTAEQDLRKARVQELLEEHNAQMVIAPIIERKSSAALTVDKTQTILSEHIYYKSNQFVINEYSGNSIKISPDNLADWDTTLDQSYMGLRNLPSNYILKFPETVSPEFISEIHFNDSEALPAARDKLFEEADIYWNALKAK